MHISLTKQDLCFVFTCRFYNTLDLNSNESRTVPDAPGVMVAAGVEEDEELEEADMGLDSSD